MVDMNKFKRNTMYETEIKIGEDTFTFKPLTGKSFALLFDIVGKLNDASKGDEEDIIKALDSDTVSKIIECETAMVKASYPEIEDDVLNTFVACNMTELLDPLLKPLQK